MHARWARFTVTRLAAVTAVAVAVTAGGVVAAADATGSAQPVVVGSCSTTVKGAPGTPVELSPSAVVAPIASIIDAVPILGPGLVAPFKSAFDALPPIPIGSLPSGSGTITGGQIAGDVVAQLNAIPLLGPVLSVITGTVQNVLTSGCQVLVTGVNAVTAPIQQGASTVDSASQQIQQQAGIISKGSGPTGGTSPGQTGSTGGGTGTTQSGGTTNGGGGSGMPAPNSPVLGGVPANLGGAGGSLFGAGTLLDYGLAESPLARYAGIPFASAGLFDPSPGVKYGGSVPGYAPSYGVLGQAGDQTDDVRTAGHAEALGAGIGPLGTGVGLPMLLAVLMLAGVTAALVRTWVLRRVRSS